MTLESNYLLASRARLARFFALSLCAACVAQAAPESTLSLEIRWPVVVKPSNPPVAPTSQSLPYLASVGAPPFRFAPPPPEAVARPEPLVTPAIVDPTAATTESTVLIEDPVTAHPPEPAQLVDTSPKMLRILPDDTPREVRAEEVMSYFQLPQERERPSASDSNLPFVPVQPAGPTLPTSSATYQQK